MSDFSLSDSGDLKVDRTWRKPPFIANRSVRWLLWSASLVYLYWVARV